MHQHTDSLRRITDLTHCWKQTHAHGKEHTHTHLLCRATLVLSSIQLEWFQNFEGFFELLFQNGLFGYQMSHNTSYVNICPTHFFIVLQNHSHICAAEPTWTCHLFFSSQTGSCAEQPWTRWCSHALQELTLLQNSNKKNCVSCSTSSDTYRKTDRNFAGLTSRLARSAQSKKVPVLNYLWFSSVSVSVYLFVYCLLQFMDVVKEDMQVVGVRVKDTKNRLKRETVIRCGNLWKGKSRKEKKILPRCFTESGEFSV